MGRSLAARTYSYDSVAWCYDELAALYSLGRIARSKRAHLAHLSPGDRVLYVGAGRGEEALEAARRGASVTAVDLSPRMLARFERVADREALDVECLGCDVFGARFDRPFDSVVANYFLNLFARGDLDWRLDFLCGLVRQGGLLCLADFLPARDGLLERLATAAYYWPLNWAAWMLGFCALHPIPDYPPRLESLGLEIVARSRFGLVADAGPAFGAIIARRSENRGVADVPGPARETPLLD